MQAVIRYVYKYAAKEEATSRDLRTIIKDLDENLDFPENRLTIRSLTVKFMNQFIGERDISAQEACHLLLGLPLVQSSRTFTRVNLTDNSRRAINLAREQGEGAGSRTVTGVTIIKRWAERPDAKLGPGRSLHQISLFDGLSNPKASGSTDSCRRCVSPLPKYKGRRYLQAVRQVRA